MSDEHEQNTGNDGGAFKPEFLASRPAFLPEPAPSDDPTVPQAGTPPVTWTATRFNRLPLPVAPSPDLPAMHMAFQERIVACLKGFIATVPQAGGMTPMVQMLERDFHRLRDLVMPPAPPPEVEAPQQDHS